MRSETVDLIWMNRAERDVKELIGEIHDIGTSDADEARLKLHGLVSIASEWLALIDRRERERQDAIAREEMETAIPPAIP